MKTRIILWALALLLPAGAGTAEEDKEGIHLTGQQNIGWNWQVNDGAGISWSISSNGSCYGGMNNVYSAGMQLYVNNQNFNWGNNGIGSPDGREVEVGPWTTGTVRVWRRMYIDPKLPYCRWIDLFENSSAGEQTISLRYYSSMGVPTRQVNTLSGKNDPTDKDWAVITSDPQNSFYPAVIHVYATKNAKVKPKFQYSKNNSSLYYNVSVKVPAGKTVALGFIEAQTKQVSDAEKFLKEFNVNKELAKIPKSLRKLLVNMPGASQTLGELELPRDEAHDLVVMNNENELKGEILNDKFTLKASFGDLDLKAPQVLGLNVPTGEEVVQIVLVDGQVVSGKLTSGPIQIRLADGGEMSVPLSKLKTASYKVSPQKPEEVVPKGPMIVLRTGQQLAIAKPDLLDCTYETQHGQLKLSPADLRVIHLDTPDGGLHRATFANGSVLSGLLAVESFKLPLALGPTLDVRRYLVKEINFPGPTLDSGTLAELSLRNEDEVHGHLAEKSVTVESKNNKVAIATDDIAEMEFPPNAFGQVKIKLHNGTTLSGKFGGRTVRFKMEPGPELSAFIGHIDRITCPKPPTASGPASQPTTGPTTKETPAASSAESAASAAECEALLKNLQAELENLKAQQAEVQKLAALGRNAEAEQQLSQITKQMAQTQDEIAKTQKRLAQLQAAGSAPPAPAPEPSSPTVPLPVPK